MQDITVGIVQSAPIQHWENKEANLSHFNEVLEEHFLEGSPDLILLPEMFNTGFSMNAHALSEQMDGSSISWLITQAEKLDSQIGATLIIEEDGRYFNRFVIVDGTGVQSTYDKRHLFRMANEHQHFTAGEQRTIHELKGWRILMQVCYDLRFPIFSRNRFETGRQDYDLVIYLANWPEKRSYAWSNLLQARAIENQAFCIGVNRIGKDGNDIPYSGDSAAYDAWGNELFECPKNQESVKILRLNQSILTDIRAKFPAYLDADT